MSRNMSGIVRFGKDVEANMARYFLGMGICISCAFVLGYSYSLYPEGCFSSDAPTLFFLVSTGCLTATMLTISLSYRFLSPLRRRRAFTIIGFVMVASGAGSVSWLPEVFASVSGMPAVIVSGVLTGVGNGLVFACYGTVLMSLPSKGVPLAVVFSFLLATFLTLLFVALPTSISRVLYPFVTITPLCAIPREDEHAVYHLSYSKISRSDTTIPLKHLLISMCLFSIVYGFQRGVYSGGLADDGYFANILFFLLTAVFDAVLVVVAARCKRFSDAIGVYRFSAILLITCLLVIPYVHDMASVVVSAVLACAYLIFEAEIWSVLSRYVKSTRRNAVLVVTTGYFSTHGGLFLGAGIGYIAMLSGSAYSGAIGVMTVIISIGLLIVSLILFPSTGFFRLLDKDAETPTEDEKDDVCSRLGQTYGLSPRELEIMKMLAAGRNTNYIENTLFISRSTVKTHKRHIFEKLGIASIQELLDLVEESGKRQR